MRIVPVLILIAIVIGSARLSLAQSTSTPTPELSSLITVVPPGGDPVEDVQEAVVVYQITDGEIINALLLFAVIVLFLLNFIWSLRRGESRSGVLPVLLLVCLLGSIGASESRAQRPITPSGQWCGYALIEGLPQLESRLPLLSLLAPDESNDRNPDELFQVKISLDGSMAIIEACWKVFPSRDVIVNLLGLGVRDDSKESIEQAITYSLFAPGESRDASAASVRAYLMENIKAWETQEE